jgi:hypothetical protein
MASQTKAQTEMYVAPKIGINGIASFSGEKDFEFDVKNGYQIGAEFGIEWFDFLGLRAEMLYANHEFIQVRDLVYKDNWGNDGILSESIDVSNGNIEFNLRLAVQLGEGFELSVGPQLSWLLSSNGSGIWDFNSGPDSTMMVDYDYLDDPAGEGAYWNVDEKEGNYFNSTTYDLNIGIGFRLFAGLYVDVRTNYDMSYLINDFYLEGSPQKREFDVLISASYRIPIKRNRPEIQPSPFVN